MMNPPLDVDITFTKPSQWVWHVSLDGKHIGTVNGDDSCGFIARDIDYRSIGHGYASAEAAIQACAPVMESPTIHRGDLGQAPESRSGPAHLKTLVLPCRTRAEH